MMGVGSLIKNPTGVTSVRGGGVNSSSKRSKRRAGNEQEVLPLSEKR
jgi:hypothetical protein